MECVQWKVAFNFLRIFETGVEYNNGLKALLKF